MSSSSSNFNGKNQRKKTAADSKDEEVDELLRAAQDDMLLKLSLNSHIARGFSSSSQFSGIDTDLDSRFQALKKPHQSKSSSKSELDDAGVAATTQKNPEKILQNVDQSDDLFARFAALKGSLPSYNTSSSAAAAAVRDDQMRQQKLMDDDNGEEDEVEKVINWAIDAARLDPSPPSDSDDDDASVADDDSDDEDGDGDGDGHGDDAGKKSKRK